MPAKPSSAPTAKQIVLQILSAADSHELTAAQLVRGTALLGIAENNLRVALNRLVAAGTLEQPRRGIYRLGAPTAAVTRRVTSWRDFERAVRPWSGAWIAIDLGGVSRTDRPTLVRSERAQRLLGFRLLTRTLAIRPDNIEPIGELRERARELDLAPGALMYVASELPADVDARARTLWDADKLTIAYRRANAAITRWLAEIGKRSLLDGARDAFFFGSDLLRQIIFDPRLPEPLVDVAQRRAMVDGMIKVDDVGRDLWVKVAVFIAHGGA